jgi:hypothetical protein
MSYDATVWKVMIATPSDVATERQIVRDVLHEWNVVNSEDRRVVLLPVGWDTHSAPEMGGRPQEIINRQVLAGCDLLVAAFWTRLGTPTGRSASGTVEEIREHLKARKPAMIYFSSEPVRPDSVDEDQYRALRRFREECSSQGLVDTYDTRAEFKEKLTRHIALTVVRRTRHFEPSIAHGDLNPTNVLVGNDLETVARALSMAASVVVPRLTDSARVLLLEAADDPNGVVLNVRTFGGLQIQTNNRQMVEDPSPRSEARWEAALQELCAEDLLVDKGHKGEVFGVTQRGYDVADRLRQQ